VFASAHLVGKNVLDAACGCGYGSDFIGRDGVNYVGVDLSSRCVSTAMKQYGRSNRMFRSLDILSLPMQYDASSFDTIVSFETVEHVSNPDHLISIFMNLLKAGGRLIMSVPLNHPDLVFHKRKYSYADVCALLERCRINSSNVCGYLQSHLVIEKISASPRDDSIGTWIGIVTK